MKWSHDVPVINGALDPEPVANPADPSPNRIFRLRPEAEPQDRGITKAMLLGLEGTAGENVTVTLYAIEKETLPADGQPDADTKYYLIGAGIVITAHEITTVSTNVPPGGFIYLRVTAEAIGADRVVKVEGVDR